MEITLFPLLPCKLTYPKSTKELEIVASFDEDLRLLTFGKCENCPQ